MGKTTLRGLARFSGISTRTLGRLRDEGVIAPDKRGAYALETTVRALLSYYMHRGQFAFRLLAAHKIFNEAWGDRVPAPEGRG